MDWSGSVEKDKARNSDKPFLASQTHLECTDWIVKVTGYNISKEDMLRISESVEIR